MRGSLEYHQPDTHRSDTRGHILPGFQRRRCGPVRGGGEGLLPLDAGSFAAMRHVLFSEPKRMLSFSLSGETEKRFAAACEVFAQVQLDRRFKTLDFYKSMKIDN